MSLSRLFARRTLPVVALIALALPLVLAACSFGQKSTTPSANYSGPVAHVKLALDWTPNTNHTGIYVAMEKGYYKQQGIDLTLLPYSSTIAPEQMVGTGQA